eukprot:ctg_1835.g531
MGRWRRAPEQRLLLSESDCAGAIPTAGEGERGAGDDGGHHDHHPRRHPVYVVRALCAAAAGGCHQRRLRVGARTASVFHRGGVAVGGHVAGHRVQRVAAPVQSTSDARGAYGVFAAVAPVGLDLPRVVSAPHSHADRCRAVFGADGDRLLCRPDDAALQSVAAAAAADGDDDDGDEHCHRLAGVCVQHHPVVSERLVRTPDHVPRAGQSVSLPVRHQTGARRVHGVGATPGGGSRPARPVAHPRHHRRYARQLQRHHERLDRRGAGASSGGAVRHPQPRLAATGGGAGGRRRLRAPRSGAPLCAAVRHGRLAHVRVAARRLSRHEVRGVWARARGDAVSVAAARGESQRAGHGAARPVAFRGRTAAPRRTLSIVRVCERAGSAQPRIGRA